MSRKYQALPRLIRLLIDCSDAQTPPRLSISRSGDVKLVGPDAPSSWFADLDSSWTRVAKDNPTFSGDHDSALPSRFWTPTEVSWRGASSATNVSETDQPERRSSNKFPDHEIRQPRDSVHGAQASSQTTLDGALRQLKAVIALQHQPKDPIDPFTTQAVEKKAVVHSLASASAPASRPVTAELDFVLSEATCQDHPQTGKSDMVCADRTSKDGLKIRWAPSVVHVQTAVKETHRSGSVRSATFPVIPASADLPLEQPLTSSHSHAEITSLLTPFNTPSSADGRQAQWSPMQALQAQPWSPTALDGSSASPVAGSPKSHNTTTLLTRDEPRSPLNLYRSTFGGTSWHSSAPPASPTGPAPPGLASQLALAPPGPPPSKLPPSPPKPVKGRSSKGQTENTVQKKDGLKQRNDVLARKNNLLSRSNDHLTRENQLLEAALVAVLKTNGRLNGCPCGSEGGVGSCRETHGPVPRSFF